MLIAQSSLSKLRILSLVSKNQNFQNIKNIQCLKINRNFSSDKNENQEPNKTVSWLPRSTNTTLLAGGGVLALYGISRYILI